MPQTVLQAAAERSEDQVLLQGPHARRREVLLIVRVAADFLRGFRALHFVGPCVTRAGGTAALSNHLTDLARIAAVLSGTPSAASTRSRRSDTVTMPTSRRPLITGNEPIVFARISAAACPIGVSG